MHLSRLFGQSQFRLESGPRSIWKFRETLATFKLSWTKSEWPKLTKINFWVGSPHYYRGKTKFEMQQRVSNSSWRATRRWCWPRKSTKRSEHQWTNILEIIRPRTKCKSRRSLKTRGRQRGRWSYFCRPPWSRLDSSVPKERTGTTETSKYFIYSKC